MSRSISLDGRDMVRDDAWYAADLATNDDNAIESVVFERQNVSTSAVGAYYFSFSCGEHQPMTQPIVTDGSGWPVRCMLPRFHMGPHAVCGGTDYGIVTKQWGGDE